MSKQIGIRAEAEPLNDLLDVVSAGDPDGFDRLFSEVYDELRRLARSRLRSEPTGLTLNTTGLVHEAYLRLVDQTRVEWRGRAHFFAVAARAMRRVLIDHARKVKADKRGGGAIHLPLEDAEAVVVNANVEELVVLDEALERLAEFNRSGAQVVECRFFGGLTYDEIGEVMGTSAVTARRTWSVARAWLHRQVREDVGQGGAEGLPRTGGTRP